METDEGSALLDEWWPRCEHCGHHLTDAGDVERPYWVCPHCRAVSIAIGSEEQ